LLIEADNVPASAAKSDNIIERLRKVHRVAGSLYKVDCPIDWDSVAVIVQRSELSKVNEVGDLIRFVKSSSGGIDVPFVLLDIDDYGKALPFMREVPTAVLARFDALELGPAGCPSWRGACVKVMLSSSEKFTNAKNESTFFFHRTTSQR
jgi:hypothetical protein